MLKAKLGDQLDPFLYRTSLLVQRMGLKPNTLTFIGMGLNGLASWALAEGEWLQGASLIVLAGFFDILDGAMARNCNEASSFGSFLDSVIDRYSDLSLLVGLLIFYSRQGIILYQVLMGLSLMGTALVPYTRARAETIIPQCNVGIMERPERILLIFLGAAIPVIMPIVVWILAIFTNLTVIQRVLYTRRTMEEEGLKNKKA
ncbi:MAG: CDP-alcohol phosphatidyltransferase family protein [Deltaproteobacteria bacterium]|jgi:CDP-diacylglycerol--glycerol-3-phosphate 3-phosphatidyltransferase|nr:CDP-alcohol phosphatidyltransferase family protein [Deltaproteobacteria bacterium]